MDQIWYHSTCKPYLLETPCCHVWTVSPLVWDWYCINLQSCYSYVLWLISFLSWFIFKKYLRSSFLRFVALAVSVVTCVVSLNQVGQMLYLKLSTRWWRKKAASTLASSDPGQSLVPPPNGVNFLLVPWLGPCCINQLYKSCIWTSFIKGVKKMKKQSQGCWLWGRNHG